MIAGEVQREPTEFRIRDLGFRILVNGRFCFEIPSLMQPTVADFDPPNPQSFRIRPRRLDGCDYDRRKFARLCSQGIDAGFG